MSARIMYSVTGRMDLPKCKDCKWKGEYSPGSDCHVYCQKAKLQSVRGIKEDLEHNCALFEPSQALEQPKVWVKCQDCGWSLEGARDERFMLCGCIKQMQANKVNCVVRDAERECEWFVKAATEEPADDGRDKERLKQWAMKGNIKDMRQWWDGYKEGFEMCLQVVEVFESGIIEEAEGAE
jgi:hypothetical protein